MEFRCKQCAKAFMPEVPRLARPPFEVPGFNGIFWERFRGHAHGSELVIDAAICPTCCGLADRVDSCTRPPCGIARPAPGVTEHIPTYPHGVDRLVCTCGYDSGVVPGALMLPDYGRDWADSPVDLVWRRHMADVAYEALTALGWRPHDAEPVPGRDYDVSPGDHWSGCLCKWCTAKAV